MQALAADLDVTRPDHVAVTGDLVNLALLLLAAVACGTVAACSGDLTKSVPTSECASGTKWVGDDEGSERMHPGRDCVGCHAGNDGPNFTIAGTMFAADGQADGCFGTGGITVEITDANGAVVTLSANEAGNFYTDSGFAPPSRPRCAATRASARCRRRRHRARATRATRPSARTRPPGAFSPREGGGTATRPSSPGRARRASAWGAWLGVEHVLASSAIPIFFPAVALKGEGPLTGAFGCARP